jgi:hypothetical protein
VLHRAGDRGNGPRLLSLETLTRVSTDRCRLRRQREGKGRDGDSSSDGPRTASTGMAPRLKGRGASVWLDLNSWVPGLVSHPQLTLKYLFHAWPLTW